MDRAADFFVSYTSSDRAWAEWIAWQLEAEGYQVVIQAWDFRPGRDFVQQMHQVVEEAQRTVAVLSPAYLSSAFGCAEWRAVFAKDPTGEHGLLLPVRVEEVEPPGLLKTRIYVDLVDRDATSARAALLAAARGARGKPTKEPEFPGTQGQAAGAAEAPRFPAELPLELDEARRICEVAAFTLPVLALAYLASDRDKFALASPTARSGGRHPSSPTPQPSARLIDPATDTSNSSTEASDSTLRLN
jgi:hypothetical protein